MSGIVLFRDSASSEADCISLLCELASIYSDYILNSEYDLDEIKTLWGNLCGEIFHLDAFMKAVDGKKISALDFDLQVNLKKKLINDVIVSSTSLLEQTIKILTLQRLEDLIPDIVELELKIRPEISDEITEFEDFHKTIKQGLDGLIPLGANPRKKAILKTLNSVHKDYGNAINDFIGPNRLSESLDNLVDIRNSVAHGYQHSLVRVDLNFVQSIRCAFEVSKALVLVLKSERTDSIPQLELVVSEIKVGE